MLIVQCVCPVQGVEDGEVEENVASAQSAATVQPGVVIAIKIWYWLEMSRLAVTREVKRLELQVVQLARRLDER